MIEKKQENCPVIKFKDIDEANRYLEEWKKKLFLTDWIIKINLCEKHEMPIEDACGANQINDMAKWCNICLLYTSRCV